MKDIDINPPFFYIILPTFNRPKLVQRAVNSVLSQNYNNYQLIIFNDGSTEDYSALENIIQNIKNVKYIKSHNVGVNKSRNMILDLICQKKNIENSYIFTLDLLRKSLLQVHPIYQCSD